MTWNAPSGSTQLFLTIGLVLLVGFGLVGLLMAAPSRSRRWIVATFTFLAGAVYVAAWAWPLPQDRKPNDIPHNFTETVSFWINDAVGACGDLSNILVAFLLGLGVFSLTRLHMGKIAKRQKDWSFSVVLFVSMIAMIIFGYWDWYLQKFAKGPDLNDHANWGTITYIKDFLFEGLLQAMDAAMFSLIAFYILSAAYRAFRIRSVEATILLSAALIVMLSLMGAVEVSWGHVVTNMTHNDPNSFLNNFKLTEIAGWIRSSFQVPGLRAIDFGIGIGALAMGLRLWLSLERGGVSS